MEKFRNLGLNEQILKVLESMHFSEPTEIQEKAIPLALKGKDIIGGSATGSGKTLAFGASIIQNLERKNGIQALILTPTRELAEQISKSMAQFSKNSPLKQAVIYGGVGMNPQIQAIRYAEVVVGTPGRILDHLRQGTLDLKNVNTLVLDEADRMLDMGFIEDVDKIISRCSAKRQTFLFSATISPDISRLAKKYMHEPVEISVDSYIDPAHLKQVYYDAPQNSKFSLLVHLLKNEHGGLIMVFCNTQRNTDFVANNLRRVKIDATPIHGGLSQARRTKTIEHFHAGHVAVLVCTDVAARGLDIKNVSHVYNYDLPPSSKEYIHRIGRTARAGKEGIAISIVSPRDYDNFRSILEDDALKIAQEQLPEMEQVFVKFSGEYDRERPGRGEGNFRGNRRGGSNFRGNRRPQGRNFRRR